MLHNKQCRFKQVKDKVGAILQIEELIHTDPNQIPEHGHFLLKIDPNTMCISLYNTQLYWVAAMEAHKTV